MTNSTTHCVLRGPGSIDDSFFEGDCSDSKAGNGVSRQWSRYTITETRASITRSVCQ